MDHQVEFRVLGPLEVVTDGRQVKVDARKQRAILAVLLIHAHAALSRFEAAGGPARRCDRYPGAGLCVGGVSVAGRRTGVRVSAGGGP